VTAIENLQSLPPYDKEKYKEMILYAAETVLGFFGFDVEQRERDIETEML
jgi:hypothetical protein